MRIQFQALYMLFGVHLKQVSGITSSKVLQAEVSGAQLHTLFLLSARVQGTFAEITILAEVKPIFSPSLRNLKLQMAYLAVEAKSLSGYRE